MIYMNMAYPGKNYRVQVIDTWLGDAFAEHPMDNPQDGDKAVIREIGDDGQPVVVTTYVYDDGEWVEEGSGGGGESFPTAHISLTANSSEPTYFSVYLSWYDEDLSTSVLRGLYQHDDIYDMGNNGEYMIEVSAGETVELDIQLTALPSPLNISFGSNATATGDAVVEFDDSWEVYFAHVTGDCTITINEP